MPIDVFILNPQYFNISSHIIPNAVKNAKTINLELNCVTHDSDD